MGTAIPLRRDFDAAGLRRLAKRGCDGAQNRRLLALAVIYDGGRRSDAARFAGVGLQIIRDWVLRFNAEGPEGLKDRKAPGPPCKLSEEQRAALAAVVESGPDPAIHGVVRWRRCDLAAWLRDRFGISLAMTTVGQELRRARQRCRGRSLMAGRGPRRTEKQDQPAMGETRHAIVRAQGPENSLGLYLRRHLPDERQGRRARHASGRYTGVERPSRRNRPHRRTRSSCPRHARSGRMAYLLGPQDPQQYHPDGAPASLARTQSRRKRLAVHPPQLALEPRLPKLRRHPRSLLQCLEQTCLTARPHRLYRKPKMDTWVLNRRRWYNRCGKGLPTGLLRR